MPLWLAMPGSSWGRSDCWRHWSVLLSFVYSMAPQERVMRYEAVHPMGSWEELRRRLGPRRRVFAFMHPRWGAGGSEGRHLAD